jgi:hypothetical protein
VPERIGLAFGGGVLDRERLDVALDPRASDTIDVQRAVRRLVVG